MNCRWNLNPPSPSMSSWLTWQHSDNTMTTIHHPSLHHCIIASSCSVPWGDHAQRWLVFDSFWATQHNSTYSTMRQDDPMFSEFKFYCKALNRETWCYLLVFIIWNENIVQLDQRMFPVHPFPMVKVDGWGVMGPPWQSHRYSKLIGATCRHNLRSAAFGNIRQLWKDGFDIFWANKFSLATSPWYLYDMPNHLDTTQHHLPCLLHLSAGTGCNTAKSLGISSCSGRGQYWWAFGPCSTLIACCGRYYLNDLKLFDHDWPSFAT